MNPCFRSWSHVLLCGACLLLCACGNDDSGNDPPAGNNGESAENQGDIPLSMRVQKEPFGETAGGEPVDRFILSNSHDVKVSVINYGAIVTSVEVPDREGRLANVTLGFAQLDGYLGDDPYFGAICGRYANRIAEGRFSLNDTEYQLATNNGPNHLHGGDTGFNDRVWRARDASDDNAAAIELTYVSPDGEEGYPGELQVKVVYSLNDQNELTIEYTATNRSQEKSTVLNLTNHCYWNLAGVGAGDVLGHRLQLHCDRYLPVDETLIPTGELLEVQGTPMDFSSAAEIGSRFGEVKGDDPTGGYDHCYVVNDADGTLKRVARVVEPTSGRVMEVRSTEPGVQLYTGNFLDGSDANGEFDQHTGFCLECQHFPDSPNHAEFPSTVLAPAQVYRQTTVHRFSVDE